MNPELRTTIMKLLEKSELQQTLINQATKALNLCHVMEEFKNTTARIESEKLLLLYGLRKNACLSEMRRLLALEHHPNKSWEDADITLEGISLRIKEVPMRSEIYNKDHAEWFVVMITQGSNVIATQAVQCPILCSKLHFPLSLTLHNLQSDFNIDVEIYSLKIENSNYNQNVKSHTLKNGPRPHRPTSFWKRSGGKTRTSLRNIDSTVRETSFTLCGRINFMIHDLAETKTVHKLNSVSFISYF